jgi:hypothetical protein
MTGCIRIIEKPGGGERVIIWRRDDGKFSYRRQWAESSVITGDDEGWGALGPELGIYDSPATAETEAMQRVPWLRASFH